MIFGLKGKSFEWVYRNKTDWVNFCLTEMKDSTGIFEVFQTYCRKKIKQESYAKNHGFQIVSKSEK